MIPPPALDLQRSDRGASDLYSQSDGPVMVDWRVLFELKHTALRSWSLFIPVLGISPCFVCAHNVLGITGHCIRMLVPESAA